MNPLLVVASLRAALPALRLNHAWLPWRTVASHLAGLTVPVPGGQPLALLAGTAWPHPEAWVRFRVDHALASSAPSAPKGDAEQQAYLQAICAFAPVPSRTATLRWVSRDTPRGLAEVTLDEGRLIVPLFRRTTVRLVLPLSEIPDAYEGWPQWESLLDAVSRAGDNPVESSAVLDKYGEIEYTTVADIGPAQSGIRGPWLSAVLTRLARDLDATRIDDPLAHETAVPSSSSAFRLSRHRKWAVPAEDSKAARQYLDRLGSRNLVYTYILPVATP